MSEITPEELTELFAGKTREESLEIALRQMLGAFDTPLARRCFRGFVFQEAIDVARHVIPLEVRDTMKDMT